MKTALSLLSNCTENQCHIDGSGLPLENSKNNLSVGDLLIFSGPAIPMSVVLMHKNY